MIIFITVLRALAALIITNSHYTGIYPTDLIANGGLLGDVIFFAVSGFCLYNIKLGFGKWYLRRIVRVYPAPIIITAVYMLIGLYARPQVIKDFLWWFIYPTNYHFVASIVVLYIPFYIVAKVKKLRENIPYIMLGVFIVYLIVYLTIYDRSYYHIDKVREPMIRFLFFEAMLMGGWFREQYNKIKNKVRMADWIMFAVLFVIYFVSKMVFVKYSSLSNYQIINQAVLVVLLYFVMRCFAGIDNKLEAMPKPLKSIFQYLSDITLEIYVVQYALIDLIKSLGLKFPVNWLLLTAAILITATLLHIVVKMINKQTDKLFLKKA